jgi:hypothetical protein
MGCDGLTLAPDGVVAWNIIGAAGDFERAAVHRLRGTHTLNIQYSEY